MQRKQRKWPLMRYVNKIDSKTMFAYLAFSVSFKSPNVEKKVFSKIFESILEFSYMAFEFQLSFDCSFILVIRKTVRDSMHVDFQESLENSSVKTHFIIVMINSMTYYVSCLLLGWICAMPSSIRAQIKNFKIYKCSIFHIFD